MTDKTVILTARNPEKAKAAAEQLVGEGLAVIPKALDVSNDERFFRNGEPLPWQYVRR